MRGNEYEASFKKTSMADVSAAISKLDRTLIVTSKRMDYHNAIKANRNVVLLTHGDFFQREIVAYGNNAGADALYNMEG